MIKQRKESIVAVREGRAPDLVAKENAEIAVLQPYLPAQLSEAELDALIAEAIAATGAASIKDMGKVMGVVKAKAAGRPTWAPSAPASKPSSAARPSLRWVAEVSPPRRADPDRAGLHLHHPQDRSRTPAARAFPAQPTAARDRRVDRGADPLCASWWSRSFDRTRAQAPFSEDRKWSQTPESTVMAGRIPQSFIDDLTARADIVELIGSRVAAEEGRPRIPRLLPVPQRENPVVLGEPGQAVLSLLRLRRARHRARLPHGIRQAVVSRSHRGTRRTAGAGRAARSRRPAAIPRAARTPLYDMNLRVREVLRERAAERRARARVREEARPHARDDREVHDRLRHQLLERSAEALRRATRPTARRSPSCGLIIERERTDSAHAGSALRPLPRPADVPDPRFARPRASASAVASSTRANPST